MEYTEDTIPAMVAYCNAMGYHSLAERWEKDGQSNFPFTQWYDEQWREFLTELGVPIADLSYKSPNWRPLRSTYANEYEAWLREKFVSSKNCSYLC